MLMLYHGSRSRVEVPCIDKCRENNDYGKGFYCTLHAELAKEWACQLGSDGFCNEYRLDECGLSVLNLNAPPFNLMNWLAVLFENRVFHLTTPTMERGARWLLNNYSVCLDEADLVKGYRADDSYFSFARAFLRNEITVGQLQSAMRLGSLGEQYMVKSPAAFEALEFVGAELAECAVYWPLRSKRDSDAREAYKEQVEADLGNYVSNYDDGRDGNSGDYHGGDRGGNYSKVCKGDQVFLSTLMRMGRRDVDALLR